MTSSAGTEWVGHVEAWRTSGESAGDFCAQRGLKVGSLRYWSGRLRRESSEALDAAFEASPVRLAKVCRTGRSGGQGTSKGTAPTIRLESGGVQVEVSRDFDPVTLSRVLDVLASRGGST